MDTFAAMLAHLAEEFAPRHEWETDPAGWAKTKLGAHMWSAQRAVLESVRDNRFTAVKSGHGVGKSFLAAAAVAWWIDTHPADDTIVITSAPTDAQVKQVLWRYISRMHRTGGLPGRVTMDAQWKSADDAVLALGRKPADKLDADSAATAFQGYHARYTLVVLDEGCGIPAWLFDAAMSLVTSADGRILVIGNPTNPASHFAKVCKPGSGWNTMRINVLDSPNFTGEEVPEAVSRELVSRQWAEDAKQRFGEDSPMYIAKVLGEFPTVSDDSLISPAWVEAAQMRSLEPDPCDTALGLDVARFGSDFTVGMLRQGQVYRQIYRAAKNALTTTAGEVTRLHLENPFRPVVRVDDIGIGGGVTDILRENGIPVEPMIASSAGTECLPDGTPKFVNARAEWYWNLRVLFQEGLVDIDPEDEDLAAQLTALQYTTNRRGQIVIESKEDMRRRGMPSPDKADALVYASAEGAFGDYSSAPAASVVPVAPPTNLAKAQW